MRAVSALALVATLVVAAQGQGQLCNFNGNSFTLPNFGSYSSGNDQYQTYGQYVPAQPSLTSNRKWQMNLCGTAANGACNSPNGNYPPSYIYELNRADGSAGSCDMGLSNFGGWFQATALDSKGNTVSSMNGTFMNAAQNRVAQVAIICGGTTDQLNPVNFPGANNGWYTYPNAAGSVWTWDVVFQYPVPGLCSGPQPPAPPATPQPTAQPGAPPTPQPPATPQPPPGPTDKPSEEEKSSAAAIIFVVLVFVLPVFYVAGTVAYNYLRLGKRGWELAPHPEFWKDFPHLCLDGCRFVKDKFLQLIGKGGSGEEYSKL